MELNHEPTATTQQIKRRCNGDTECKPCLNKYSRNLSIDTRAHDEAAGGG